jgi:hypothetical protein
MKKRAEKAIPAGSHIFLIFEKKLLQQECRSGAILGQLTGFDVW